MSEREARIEALRDGWNRGTRKARGEAWVDGLVINCWSCMGSPISRGGMAAVGWLGWFVVVYGRMLEIFDVGGRTSGRWQDICVSITFICPQAGLCMTVLLAVYCAF